MIPRHLILSFALAIAAAIPSLQAAQSTATSKLVASDEAKGCSSANANQPTFSIDFPGGTIADLVNTVTRNGGTLSIIGDKADMKIELPPFSLRNVTTEMLASALRQFMRYRGFEINSSGEIYVLSNYIKQPGQNTFDAYQLASYLEYQSVEEICDAIQTAWTLNPSTHVSSPQLKYHKGTTTLFVSGDHEAIEIAKRVISVLRRKSDPSDPTERKALLEKITEEIRGRLDQRQGATPKIDASSNKDPKAEAARLRKLAEEVMKRREQRQSTGLKIETPTPAPSTDK